MTPASTASLAAIAVFAALDSANAREVETGPSPVVVLAIDRPWQAAPVPQTPDFVLYDNRFVIQRKFQSPGPDEYRGEVVDEARYAILIARLRELAAGARWAAWYEPKPHPSDQPTTRIFARFGETTIVSAVHGREACNRPAAAASAPSEVPRDLCRFIDEVAQFRLSKPSRWVPVEVDVKLLPEEGGPGWRKRTWPKGWPGVHSSRATKDGNDYWIRLDGKYLSDLDVFLKRLGPLGLVALAGKTWVAVYRVPYPGEDEWEKRFEAAR